MAYEINPKISIHSVGLKFCSLCKTTPKILVFESFVLQWLQSCIALPIDKLTDTTTSIYNTAFAKDLPSTSCICVLLHISFLCLAMIFSLWKSQELFYCSSFTSVLNTVYLILMIWSTYTTLITLTSKCHHVSILFLRASALAQEPNENCQLI